MAETAATALEAASAPFTRRLLTILAADVVGYARLTEVAEEDTHRRLRSMRVNLVDPCIVSYRGRIVKNTGDGFLAAFDSSVDAMSCALELQNEITASERSEAPDRKITFRMGLNSGRTIVEPEDVYGFGVNVAARLEQCAPAGGIIVSADVLDQVKARLDVPVEDLGPLRLKNLSRPIHAFSVKIPGVGRPEAAAAKRTRPTRRAKVPSIAVLPFRNAGAGGGGDDDDYFGDGMVEDIIVALQSIRGLLVIARTSTLSYRDGPVDVQKIGQDLGVRYVLSGSIRRTDRQVRLVVELADVEAGAVIWADRYDGDLSELFEFQDRIATRIVWSVAPHVREAELKRAMRKRPSNMNAYDLVMQAIDLMYRMKFEEFTQAGALLQQAIATDQTYATAHAYAALWHIHSVAQGWAGDDGDGGEAARLASTAIELDPADGFALAILGHTKARSREYDAASNIFERALDAAPSNAMAWTLSSGVYGFIGDGRQAVDRAQHGLRLSPSDTQAFFYLMFLGQAHYINGAYDEALIWSRKTAGLNGRLCANLRVLAAAHAALGQHEEARRVAGTLINVQPRFRVSVYAEHCPFEPALCAKFVGHLREAGLPD